MNPTIDAFHWADINAEKIIREKGDKDVYTCASGITPSGTVHIGNFREIISVELVVRALRDRGKKVRFIYSWDDYDVFRKVPKNMPQPDRLETFLRKPITMVPDVIGGEKSYAAYNEKELEKHLPTVGVYPEYIYQAERYCSSAYAKEIRVALEHREVIRKELDAHRAEPLAADWYPVSVFCTACDRDTTDVTGWDGEWGVSYSCTSCGHKETLDLRSTPAAKLPWRIDWPMRWAHEKVDFEPAGKDHHSEGGSFTTAQLTAKEVFGFDPPVTFQYDFVRIKGRGGKISSSSGEVVSLPDVLAVYQPEIVRFLFAGTRPNTEFAISFDLDVLKIYEDYDKCERTFFNTEEKEKKPKEWGKQARIYELSQVGEIPESIPYQMPVRHLCNLLQIHDGDIEALILYLGDVNENQIPRFRQRALCAWNWIREFAPEDFRFSIRKPGDPKPDIPASVKPLVSDLTALVRDKMDGTDEETFGTLVYDAMKVRDISSADFFTPVYRILIGKDKGPRLVSFIFTIGRERVLSLLESL